MSEPEHAVETADAPTGAVTTPAPPITNSQQPIANSQQPTASPPQRRSGQGARAGAQGAPGRRAGSGAGSSVDELIASVEPARTAYQRIADQVRRRASREGEESGVGATASGNDLRDSGTTNVVQPPAVPAGGGTNVARPGRSGADHEDRAGPGRAQDEGRRPDG